MRFLDEMTYDEWWDAQPWHFRLRHSVWWVWSTICSYYGDSHPMRPTPEGERLSIYARAFGAVP